MRDGKNNSRAADVSYAYDPRIFDGFSGWVDRNTHKERMRILMKKDEEVYLKKMGNYFLLAGLAFMLAICCCACHPSPVERFNDWMGWNDDNIAEEAAEFIIEKESGFDVDLSPRSPE